MHRVSTSSATGTRQSASRTPNEIEELVGHTIVYRELSMHVRKLHISSENIWCLARTRNLFACSLFVTGKRFRLKNFVEGPCLQLTATPVARCQLTPTTPSTQKTLQNSSVIMKRRTPDFYYTQNTLLLNAPVLSSKVLTLMCSSYVLPMWTSFPVLCTFPPVVKTHRGCSLSIQSQKSLVQVFLKPSLDFTLSVPNPCGHFCSLGWWLGDESTATAEPWGVCVQALRPKHKLCRWSSVDHFQIDLRVRLFTAAKWWLFGSTCSEGKLSGRYLATVYDTHHVCAISIESWVESWH